MSMIYEKFMINIKLIKNSIIGMVPFLAVLGTQVLLFASLNSVKGLNDLYHDTDEELIKRYKKIPTGHQIVGLELFETAMIIFGPKGDW